MFESHVRISALWRAFAALSALWSAGATDASRRQLASSGSDVTVVRLGGSLSFTGTNAGISKHYFQGVQLVARKVNEKLPFMGPGGSRLQVDLSNILDDHHNENMVAMIYDSLAGRVDFFLGPYGSALSSVAAQVINQTGMIGMLCGASAPHIYQNGYRNIFTSNAMANEYAWTGLEHVAKVGSRSMSYVSELDSFSKSMCDGAADYAEQQLGMHVLARTSTEESSVIDLIRQVMEARPEVLVSCGHFAHAVDVVLSSRALDYNPEGMIITMAASEMFTKTVGAPNANFMISPVSWSPSLELSDCQKCAGAYDPNCPRCPLFDSSEDFAAQYKAMYNEEAVYQSAEAAAGVLALLEAIQIAGSMEVDKVRAALLGMKMETFFGPLSFFPNGTQRIRRIQSEQVQPFNYTVSKMKLLEDEDLPLWPMPPWRERQVDVFPCGPGEVWLSHKCEKCGVGRYRNPRETRCEDCGPGRYSALEGLSRCENCPKGADCPDRERPGFPNATAGHFRLPSNPVKPLTIAECDPPELCLGSNVCTNFSTGILCAECIPGYARHNMVRHLNGGVQACAKCHSTTWHIVTIAFPVLVYILYIWVLVHFTLSAAKSIRALHSVILKISVNYVQFAGIAFAATDFGSMVIAIAGHGPMDKIIFPLLWAPGVMNNPIEFFVNMDCLLGNQGIKSYQMNILIGLFIMPVAFLVKVVIDFVCKEIYFKRVAPEIRRCFEQLQSRCRRDAPSRSGSSLGRSGSCLCDSMSISAAPELFVEAGGGFSSPGGGGGAAASPSRPPARRSSWRRPTWWGTQPAAASGSGDDLGAPTSSCCISLEDLSPQGSPLPRKRTTSTKEIMNAIANRFINSSIVMSFVLHALVVRLLVLGFECEEFDVLRQKHNLDTVCGSKEHMRWATASVLGVVIYGFGTPAILLLLLCRHKNELMEESVRKRFGFLYNGFEFKYWYFECIYMTRKVLFWLLFTIPSRQVRLVLMLCASWTFMVWHVRTMPFDNRSFFCFDRLEMWNLLALIATVTARLIFDLRTEVEEYVSHSLLSNVLVDGLLIGGPLFCHAWYILFAAWSLFRNTVLKHLTLKMDVLGPDKLSWTQQHLLQLEKFNNKAIFKEEGGCLSLDTQALTKQEQQYLFVALSDTLNCYVDSERGRYMSPDEFTAILKRALVHCQTVRRRKQNNYRKMLRKQKFFGTGCVAQLLKWQAYLSISLQPQTHVASRAEDENDTADSATSWWYRLHCWTEELGAWLSRRSLGKTKHDPFACRDSTPPLEAKHEFTVEDLYEVLMPIWEDISQGNLPWKAVPNAAAHKRNPSVSDYISEYNCKGLSAETIGVQESITEAILEVEDTSPNVEALLCEGVRTCPSHAHAAAAGGSRDALRMLRQHEDLVSENMKLRRDRDALREALRRVRAASPDPPAVQSSSTERSFRRAPVTPPQQLAVQHAESEAAAARARRPSSDVSISRSSQSSPQLEAAAAALSPNPSRRSRGSDRSCRAPSAAPPLARPEGDREAMATPPSEGCAATPTTPHDDAKHQPQEEVAQATLPQPATSPSAQLQEGSCASQSAGPPEPKSPEPPEAEFDEADPPPPEVRQSDARASSTLADIMEACRVAPSDGPPGARAGRFPARPPPPPRAAPAPVEAGGGPPPAADNSSPQPPASKSAGTAKESTPSRVPRPTRNSSSGTSESGASSSRKGVTLQQTARASGLPGGLPSLLARLPGSGADHPDQRESLEAGHLDKPRSSNSNNIKAGKAMANSSEVPSPRSRPLSRSHWGKGGQLASALRPVAPEGWPRPVGGAEGWP